MNRLAVLFGGMLVLAIAMLVGGQSPKPADAGMAVADFQLTDTQGKKVALADFKDKKAVAVVFLGTECPLVNLYALRLIELHKEFSDKGVQFLAINSNSQDTSENVAAHARKYAFPFPVLKDPDNKVADLFQAEKTPEVFLLDGQRRIVYRGRIDDQYGIGYQRAKPNRRDLAEAIQEVLKGEAVSVARTEAEGCYIGRIPEPKATHLTYTRDIAPIIQKHCQECHREGQIGPFSLMTYEKARSWSKTIKRVVSDGRMPPWHADPKHGKFANDRSLPEKDKQKLLAWIDAGCPKGDEKDMPPPRQFTGEDGWSIGKPDIILSMREDYKVPATAPRGGIPYKYFIVPTDFKEDIWVQAAEARPGNKGVVHHILVYVVEPGAELRPDLVDGLGKNLLCATAPGDLPARQPPGTAKKIPKGSRLLFQMHYTPNGIEGTDRSSVGIIVAKEPPRHIVRTRAPLNRSFAIPPGAENHVVKCSTKFDKDAVILSFMPHMHLRGKSFEYKVVYPDGKSEILLWIPRYDFGWQTYYHLEKPLRVPAGTRIECTAEFDNSEKNRNNPDPTKTVKWGDQTWEEMMIGWLDYYFVDEKVELPAKSER